jgi:hypothetical protein
MIEQITTHAAQALDRLAEQFRNKASLAAVLNANSAQVQALEDALWSLITHRAVGTATGAQLDEVGAIVGQPRSVSGPDATDDAAYRALIYGRIIVNTSGSNAEPIYALLRQLGATGAYQRDHGLASLGVQYTGDLLVDDAALIRLIELATGPVTITITEYESGPFGFAGTPGALGFGVGKLARSVT